MLPSDPLILTIGANNKRDRILPLMGRYPLQAGPLYTAYKDLALAVEWQDLRIVELQGTGWVCIVGHKRKEDALRIVLPLPLHTTALRPSSLKSLFTAARSLTLENLPKADEPLVPSIDELKAKAGIKIDGHERADNGNVVGTEMDTETEKGTETATDLDIDRDTLYMAICTTDATVVYYKLARGIRKPADIPDE